MTNTPPASSVVQDGEPSTPRSAALPAGKGLSFEKVKPVEPSLIWKIAKLDTIEAGRIEAKRAIQHDIEQRRARIARKLEP